MPKFSANLSMLFTELPFLERFEAAAQADFTAVEFLFPYAYSVKEIKNRLDANGLELVLHNLPAGDWEAGERGIACLPDRVEEFRTGVATAINYAKSLGVQQLNCLAGKSPIAIDSSVVRQTLVSNLRYAASELDAAGLKLLIEPINTYDIPGFYLNRTQQALDILDEVGADNAFVQYDIYHAQRMEGELAATIKKIWHASAISNWQTTRVATSRAQERSTTFGCSNTWMRLATAVGWVASTSLLPQRLLGWAGSSEWYES